MKHQPTWFVRSERGKKSSLCHGTGFIDRWRDSCFFYVALSVGSPSYQSFMVECTDYCKAWHHFVLIILALVIEAFLCMSFTKS